MAIIRSWLNFLGTTLNVPSIKYRRFCACSFEMCFLIISITVNETNTWNAKSVLTTDPKYNLWRLSRVLPNSLRISSPSSNVSYFLCRSVEFSPVSNFGSFGYFLRSILTSCRFTRSKSNSVSRGFRLMEYHKRCIDVSEKYPLKTHETLTRNRTLLDTDVTQIQKNPFDDTYALFE